MVVAHFLADLTILKDMTFELNLMNLILTIPINVVAVNSNAGR